LDRSVIRTTEEDLALEDSKDLEEEPVRIVLDRSAIKTILERRRGKPSSRIVLDPSAIRTTEEDLDLEDLEDSKDLEEEPVRTVLDRSAIKTILERNRGKPKTAFTDCVGTQYKKYILSKPNSTITNKVGLTRLWVL